MQKGRTLRPQCVKKVEVQEAVPPTSPTFFAGYCCGLRREAGLFTKRVRSAEGREQRRSRSSAPVFIHFPQLSRYTRAS